MLRLDCGGCGGDGVGAVAVVKVIVVGRARKTTTTAAEGSKKRWCPDYKEEDEGKAKGDRGVLYERTFKFLLLVVLLFTTTLVLTLLIVKDGLEEVDCWSLFLFK